MTDTDPAFETLAARSGVERRETVHEVGDDGFEDARESVDDGLTWAVGAVVTDPDGRVLLVREDGRWLAPGGVVEPGETHPAALVREVREETGVDVAPQDLVAVTDVTFRHQSTGETTGFYFAHYTATPDTTTLTEDPGLPDEDIEAVTWAASVPADTVDRDVIVANSPAESL